MEDELVDENYAPIIEKLVRGTTTTERPEVGALQIGSGGLRTGTLVGENLVISAAHCFDFVTQTQTSLQDLIRSNGSLYQYPVSVVSLGSTPAQMTFYSRDLDNRCPNPWQYHYQLPNQRHPWAANSRSSAMDVQIVTISPVLA